MPALTAAGAQGWRTLREIVKTIHKNKSFPKTFLLSYLIIVLLNCNEMLWSSELRRNL
jgi:hypothetical protein